jgi:hypothetical protein
MRHLARLNLGTVFCLATLVTVVVVLSASGGRMFSPGQLNAQGQDNVTLGGVASHAELSGKCSACHAPPWSSDTMATRCLECHTSVREQIEASGPLHGMMTDTRECRGCHTEHRGPHGSITSLVRFDHDFARFKLTGKHRTVDCKSCHVNNVFKGTSQTCVSCHNEPQEHKGRYGTACAQCHTTSTWKDSTFKHTAFSINHGNRRNSGGNKCATCHTDETNFKVYTCYNCHEHRPAKIEQKHARRNIVNFQDCTRCHGRKGRRAALDEGADFALCLAPTGTCDLFSGADTADLFPLTSRLDVLLGKGECRNQRMGELPIGWEFFDSPQKRRPPAVDRDNLPPAPRAIAPLEQWLPASLVK